MRTGSGNARLLLYLLYYELLHERIVYEIPAWVFLVALLMRSRKLNSSRDFYLNTKLRFHVALEWLRKQRIAPLTCVLFTSEY